MHPNGPGTKGTPVKLNKDTGEVLAGLGGKFNGRHISALPDGGRHEQHGAQAVIARSKVGGVTGSGAGSAKGKGQVNKPSGGASVQSRQIYSALGQKHHDAIEALASKGRTAKVWKKYASKTKVVRAHYKGLAYYSPSDKGIYTDIDKDANGDKYQAPYTTTMHELGHNIDNISSGQEYRYTSVEFDNGAYGKAIREDVDKLVNDLNTELKNEFKTLGAIGFARKYDSKLRGEQLAFFATRGVLRYQKKYAYRLLENLIRESKKDGCYPQLSDIVEGGTKAKCQAGFGHGASYWKYAGMLEKEAFAHMFSLSSVNPGAYNGLKGMLPKSVAVFERMIAELEK